MSCLADTVKPPLRHAFDVLLVAGVTGVVILFRCPNGVCGVVIQITAQSCQVIAQVVNVVFHKLCLIGGYDA